MLIAVDIEVFIALNNRDYSPRRVSLSDRVFSSWNIDDLLEAYGGVTTEGDYGGLL